MSRAHFKLRCWSCIGWLLLLASPSTLNPFDIPDANIVFWEKKIAVKHKSKIKVLLHLEEFFFVQFTVAINVHVFEESCCVCSCLREIWFNDIINQWPQAGWNIVTSCWWSMSLCCQIVSVLEEETNLLVEGRPISALRAKHRVDRLHHTGHLLFVDCTTLVRIVTTNFKNYGLYPHSRN